MATIDAEITQTRFDIRDEDSTQYSATMVLAFYNRVIEALATFLGSVQSDWVFNSTSLTLPISNSSVALPTDFSTDILVQIDDTDLVKKSVAWINEELQENATGIPSYYGIHKTNMIFERTASSEQTVFLQYNQKSTTLVSGNSMPYNDEFNNELRGGVIIIAKNRNERKIVGDFALHEFFRQTIVSKTVRRVRQQAIKDAGF
jgi:hypothetical protein